MIRLFSSFDLILFRFSFISVIFIPFVIACSFSFNNFLFLSSTIVLRSIIRFFHSLTNIKFKMFDTILLSLITLVFRVNFLSILPFNFAFTSQVSFNFYWGFSIWLALFTFLLFKNFKYFLIHMIPEGTPIFLIWFLFFVELVSNIIRPLTLVVRLLANILAGHLLMILLSKLVLSSSPFLIFYLGLNIVELFVSVIQSYIFVTIICLYYSEIC